MSQKLSISEKRKVQQFKLYSENEFLKLTGAENRQERLLAAVYDDREAMLNETDFKYLELLRRAFFVMTSELSPILRDKKVLKLLEVPNRRRLRQIKEDVNYIFCNVEERNIELERKGMEHKISKLINRLIRVDPGHKSIEGLLKLLDKIKGTSVHDKKSLPWNEWQPLIPVYTKDINDITPVTTEDIEHEEIE